MAASSGTWQSDFSEMDNAGISKEHWKIMFISGMGFFTDAYDLFIIGVVMALLKPMWHVGKVEEGLVELDRPTRRGGWRPALRPDRRHGGPQAHLWRRSAGSRCRRHRLRLLT